LVWPAPADPRAARNLAERIGNSPFLAELAAREVRTLRAFVRFGPDAVIKCVMAQLTAANPAAPRAEIARTLREAKRRTALVVALGDIAGIWPLARITGALSDLAEQCLELAVAHLLRAAHDRGRLRLPDPTHPWQGSGFAVLGMGKLGARELNYSSDIDLILLYDPELYPAGERSELSGVFNRIARDLVTLLERRDQDGCGPIRGRHRPRSRCRRR
jgi:glutamate-ammonia-ligase adenylyltransferase